MNEDEARKVVKDGEALEELLQHPGWTVLLEEYIERGLDVKRILGARPGKLMWFQGFMSALDSQLRFIKSKIEAKDKIIKDQM